MCFFCGTATRPLTFAMAMINWNNFGLFDLRSLYHVFYCFADLTKKNTEDISVVIAKITVNAVISKLQLLTTETAECILSVIMLSLMCQPSQQRLS